MLAAAGTRQLAAGESLLNLVASYLSCLGKSGEIQGSDGLLNPSCFEFGIAAGYLGFVNG